MTRIFIPLAIFSNLSLLITLYLGWRIEDAGSVVPELAQQVSNHFLIALAATTLVLLVHAIVLTYFMGTGRWIEETSAAYKFEPTARAENIKLKYRVLPGMVLCMSLVIITGAFGAIADPASQMTIAGSATIHFTLAVVTLLTNLFVSWIEYIQIARNTEVVNLVYAEVQAVRKEHGYES